MIPFSYPETPHVRRHGPSGYDNCDSFRPWLRDEFLFRCVYCLKREQWGTVRGNYDIEHFRPESIAPEDALVYSNLLYACATCNSAKRAEIVPDPCNCMLRDGVVVHENGSIEGTKNESKRLILKLGLDDSEYREFRQLWIGVVAMASESNKDLFRLIMKYPDKLPDLSKLRPPRNSRKEGIKQSCHARRLRGQLPETY